MSLGGPGRSRPPLGQELVLLLDQPVAARELAQRGRLTRRHARAMALRDVGSGQPGTQARLGDSKVVGDLSDRSIPVSTTAEN